MSDTKELEKRIVALERECRRLRDIENIRQLRYKYWRAIRDGNLPGLLGLFCENPFVDLGMDHPAQGREAVEKLYRDIFGTLKPRQMYPRGFVPEIEMTGDDTATGVWMVEAPALERKKEQVRYVGCLYDEEYVREGGGWKISRLKTTYTYNQYTSMVPPK